MNGDLVITNEQQGKRLDHILPEVLHVSRSFVQKHVKEGHIRVNGKTVAPHYFVKENDSVTWDITEEKTIVTPNANLNVPILFEDDDLLVIDKPAGLVVHQGDGHRGSDTLVNWLLHTRPEVQGIGDDSLRPGIVHRLDRDVSGVMLIAKTKNMYTHLLRLFSQGTVTKEYEAIVYGEVKKPEDVITFPLARSKTKGWKIAARPLDQESGEETREAITHIVRMHASQHYTHLRVMPKTGRMHQIRAHLAGYRHPIVGDTLYAGKELHPERVLRLFLHATRIHFLDYNGKERVYASVLPKEFTSFVQ